MLCKIFAICERGFFTGYSTYFLLIFFCSWLPNILNGILLAFGTEVPHDVFYTIWVIMVIIHNELDEHVAVHSLHNKTKYVVL